MLLSDRFVYWVQQIDLIPLMQKLVDVQTNIQHLLSTFSKAQQNVSLFTQSTFSNNSKVFSTLRRLFQTNLHPLSLILTHLTDHQLLTAASTCRTLYKLVYSPFGYKLLKSLRPLIIQVHKIEQQPIVSISMFDGESKSSLELINDQTDEDDLQAAVMAMNTNILAMMHKIKEIQRAKKRVNAQCSTLVTALQQESQLKEFLNEKNTQRLYRIQQEEHMGQDCQKHLEQLMLEQQMKSQDKEEKIETVRKERDKLLAHKELLIKKLKAVMVEIEQQKTMSMQVANIMGKLQHILKKK